MMFVKTVKIGIPQKLMMSQYMIQIKKKTLQNILQTLFRQTPKIKKIKI